MRKNNLFYLSFHVLFCLLLTYWFYSNSILRPACMDTLYKEVISAIIVLLLIYGNYFIAVPKLLRKNLYIKYILLSVLLIITSGVMELFIVESNIAQCVGDSFPNEIIYRGYIRYVLFMIIMRNVGFYIFFTLLSMYRNSQIDFLKKEKSLLQEKDTIVFLQSNKLPISFNINKIIYFEQRQNKTNIFTTFGTQHIIYSSLADQKSSFGDRCLKINRNTLVFYDKVVRYNQEYLTVKDPKNGGIKMLYFYKNNPLSVYEILQKKIPHLEAINNNFTPQKTFFDNVKAENHDENVEIDHVKTAILEEIMKNPGINALKLFENLQQKTSLSTLRRKLKELKKLGKITYQGSDKRGGYYVV